MVIIEHLYQSHQAQDVVTGAETRTQEEEDKPRQRPPIGEFLRRLRGARTLRRVEADTRVTNAYLSNIELGLKKPGIKTLAKLGIYYGVPLNHLLHVAGLQDEAPQPAQQESVIDIQRAYGFVLGDPNVAQYQKPPETPPLEMQKFVVRLYEHYTGRKLL